MAHQHTDLGHDHGHSHGHVHTRDTSRLLGAFGVIVIFMLVEIVGGLISGSLALLADAAHMFADAVALGLAASAQIIARRPPDSERHFGYQRVQVLAAFFNGATLLVLAIWIVVEAGQRFLNPTPVEPDLMLTVAFAGFVANAIAFGMLQTSASRNVNVKGALLHVIADLLSSIAAIVAAALIKTTGSSQYDPLLSVVVALLISYSAIRLLIETGHILLEGAPKGIDVDALKAGVKLSAPGVEDVHDVRIWQMTPEAASLTLHARIKNASDAKTALDRIKSYLEREYGIRQSTVQIETDECPDCDLQHSSDDREPQHAPVQKAAAESVIHHHGVHAHAAMATHHK